MSKKIKKAIISLSDKSEIKLIDEIINLNFEIAKVEINKFWTIRGIPKINLIKIKYS